jgi:hypothetical protein
MVLLTGEMPGAVVNSDSLCFCVKTISLSREGNVKEDELTINSEHHTSNP